MTGQDFETATSYMLTDEDVERAKLLVGREIPSGHRESSTRATPDAMRVFAMSIGDDNPLFCDEGYGEVTRWGSQIASGVMARNINTPLLGDPLPDDVRARTRSIFKGVHEFMSGSTWEWFRPILPGDRLYSFSYVDGVEVKPSSFARRTALVSRVEIKFGDEGDVVARRAWVMIHSERKAAASVGKYANLSFDPYTEEQIQDIDAVYAQEQRRGATPRYWEDVEVGESLGRMAKGPLTVTEVIMFHAGGFGLHPFLSASRLAYKNRLRFPAFYINNDDGVPEVGQRVHWDSKWAQAIGNPRAYDYGFMRQCWLHHFLTDWCGDDGFVLEQHDEIRRFNYIGDVTIMSGHVEKKDALADGQKTVEVALTGTNQRGEDTVIGGATIALPSREHGPVVLPNVPDDLKERAMRMLDRHVELSRAKETP